MLYSYYSVIRKGIFVPTTVETTKTLNIDDKTIELRPLKIKRLREFMKEFDKITKVGSDNDKSLDVLLRCCSIAMKQYDPSLVDIDALEELLDISDVYLIVEAATGIRLGDGAGNPIAAAQGGTS